MIGVGGETVTRTSRDSCTGGRFVDPSLDGVMRDMFTMVNDTVEADCGEDGCQAQACCCSKCACEE
jgi:hypothetical protein